MTGPLCIVGIGSVTAVGLNAWATAAAVRAGIDNFSEHPYMINQLGEPYILAMVPTIAEDLILEKRFVELAAAAIREALEPLEVLQGIFDIPAIIGLPEVKPGVSEELGKMLAAGIRTLRADRYRIEEVRTAFKGHAAGLMALQSGRQAILNKSREFCLIGGVESYLDPDTLDWIEDHEQLHTPDNAWGFIPGEAASFCLVCSAKTANRYKLPIRAQLLSIATAREENCIKTETVCIGKGLTSAVKEALQAVPERVKINQTYCDQNGEAYRADEFGFMLARLSEHFMDPSDYTAPADCWGDVGPASGPLFINLLTAAAEKGYGNGPYSLLWSSSEGGERTAAVFRADIREKGLH